MFSASAKLSVYPGDHDLALLTVERSEYAPKGPAYRLKKSCSDPKAIEGSVVCLGPINVRREDVMTLVLGK